MSAPLPTLRRSWRTRQHDRLVELLNAAEFDLRMGDTGAALASLLSAIEVAYGLGKLPEEITRRIDTLNELRRPRR